MGTTIQVGEEGEKEKREIVETARQVLRDILEIQEECFRDGVRMWVKLCRNAPLAARILWKIVKNELTYRRAMYDPTIRTMIETVEKILQIPTLPFSRKGKNRTWWRRET